MKPDLFNALAGTPDPGGTWTGPSGGSVTGMLDPGTDLEKQVLQTERLMLTNGITPSVYFRFPGDVSDRLAYDKIAAYGFVGIGTDGWLAKGQHPRGGGTILINAKGGRQLTKPLFIEALKNNKAMILDGRWTMYDL